MLVMASYGSQGGVKYSTGNFQRQSDKYCRPVSIPITRERKLATFGYTPLHDTTLPNQTSDTMQLPTRPSLPPPRPWKKRPDEKRFNIFLLYRQVLNVPAQNPAIYSRYPSSHKTGIDLYYITGTGIDKLPCLVLRGNFSPALGPVLVLVLKLRDGRRFRFRFSLILVLALGGGYL